MKKTEKQKDQAGFTILELLIAAIVFSLVLLICTFSIIQISRTYIRGYIQSSNQNNARSLVDQLSRNIQLSSNNPPDSVVCPATGGNCVCPPTSLTTVTWCTQSPTNYWFCINGTQYVYALNKQLKDTPTLPDQAQFVFMAYTPTSGCTSSTVPFPLSSPPAGSIELVNSSTRVVNFSLNQIDTVNNLYQISFDLLYGDSNTFNGSNPPSCLDIAHGGAYCSTTTITTTAQQRL